MLNDLLSRKKIDEKFHVFSFNTEMQKQIE